MNKIPLKIEDTSLEIIARIAKAEARKYNCSIDIDFSGDRRNISFVGDEKYASHIIQEVRNLFPG